MTESRAAYAVMLSCHSQPEGKAKSLLRPLFISVFIYSQLYCAVFSKYNKITKRHICIFVVFTVAMTLSLHMWVYICKCCVYMHKLVCTFKHFTFVMCQVLFYILSCAHTAPYLM